MIDGSEFGELRALATRLSQIRQADIFIYSGELTRPGDGSLVLGRNHRPRRATCLLVLSTLGGAADAAYRLARALGRRYTRLTVYVDDYCKGAGMLLALAAHELVISDFGELGPLDLTSQHPSTPGQRESGLALVQGLQALRAEAETSFEQYLTRFRAGRQMTSRAALEQASALSVGLMSPVFSQIDPLQIAEVDRALQTARLYTQRLGEAHLKPRALDRLLTGYPSHDFVIDREEADDLLRTVRAPTPEEVDFLTQVEPILGDRRTQARLLRLEDALRLVESTPAPNREPNEGAASAGSRPAQDGRSASAEPAEGAVTQNDG